MTGDRVAEPTTASSVLTAHQLVRRFAGKAEPAVDGVSFEVGAGEIVTLLGPNGAGKTTTVSMCSGLLEPTAGTVSIGGKDVYRRRSLGAPGVGLVLGGEKGFYGRATVWDNLLFFADLARVPWRDRIPRVEEVLELVELSDRASSTFQELSRGMKQRLHIARGLLGKPSVLLLDEPTMGLDPRTALNIRALVRTVSSAGCGVLLTTHHLVEAEELSDRVLVLRRGRVLVDGSVDHVRTASGIGAVTSFSAGPGDRSWRDALDDVGSAPRAIDERLFHERRHVAVQWSRRRDAEAFANSIASTDLILRHPSLEECYLELVGTDA